MFGKSFDNLSPADNEVPVFDVVSGLWKPELPAGGSGEINTSSNVGTGEGLAKAKVVFDLPFKSLIGDSEIVLVGNTDDITFSISALLARLATAQTWTAKQTFQASIMLAAINLNDQVPTSKVAGDFYRNGNFLEYVDNANISRVLVQEALAQTINNKTFQNCLFQGIANLFPDDALRIERPAGGNVVYTIQAGAILSNQIVNLPIISAADTFAFLNVAQIFQNKDLTNPNNTFNLFNVDINASAAILTSKLADSANFVLINKANTYGDFIQKFKDDKLQIESPNGLSPVTILNSQQITARTATIPVLTGDRLFLMSDEAEIGNNDIGPLAAIQFTKMIALTASRALETNGSGIVIASTITSLELSRLAGVSSAIQTQLDTKVETSSNVGTGAGLAKAKVGNDLPFKSIIGELLKIIITDNADDITITLGTNIDNSNIAANADINLSKLLQTSIQFVKGGTILDPAGAINIISWRAPFACTVKNVRGYRVGGTGATINARKNGSLNHLSSALSLTSVDTWQDGGAVSNATYAAGDKLEIMIVTVVASPTQIGIQVDFERA